MPHQGIYDEHEHRMTREEIEHVGRDAREEHVVREESYGPAEGIEEHAVILHEVAPTRGGPHDSALERDEVVSAREDSWRFTVRVLQYFSTWVGVMLAVMEALLALRLFFLLAAASPRAGFVSFVNGSTGWMVALFQGIGPNSFFEGGGVFEPATLAAMLVYPVLAILVILILRAIAASPRPEVSYTRRSSNRRTF